VLAISRNSPDLGGRHLAQQAAKLSVIKEEFKNSMSDTVGRFVADSPKVRANLVDSISTFWEPGFENADRVPGGPGVTKRKQDALSTFCRQHGEKVFKLPVVSVRKRIKRGLDKLKPGFERSLSRLVDSARLQTLLFSRNIAGIDALPTIKVEKTTGGAVNQTPREQLVAQLRTGCLQWSEAWQGQDFENLEATHDYSVPLQWSLGKNLCPIEDSDSDDSDSDSDEDEDETEDHGATKVDQDIITGVEEDIVTAVNDEDAVMVLNEQDVITFKKQDVVMDVMEEDIVTVFKDDDVGTVVKEEDDAREEWRWVFFSQQD